MLGSRVESAELGQICRLPGLPRYREPGTAQELRETRKPPLPLGLAQRRATDMPKASVVSVSGARFDPSRPKWSSSCRTSQFSDSGNILADPDQNWTNIAQKLDTRSAKFAPRWPHKCFTWSNMDQLEPDLVELRGLGAKLAPDIGTALVAGMSLRKARWLGGGHYFCCMFSIVRRPHQILHISGNFSVLSSFRHSSHCAGSMTPQLGSLAQSSGGQARATDGPAPSRERPHVRATFRTASASDFRVQAALQHRPQKPCAHLGAAPRNCRLLLAVRCRSRQLRPELT